MPTLLSLYVGANIEQTQFQKMVTLKGTECSNRSMEMRSWRTGVSSDLASQQINQIRNPHSVLTLTDQTMWFEMANTAS